MKLRNIFGESADIETARALYGAIVRQAREADFYRRLDVPDTPDGRFDMIALHAVLVIRRLKRDHARTKTLSQALFDLMFADMDQNLRELGVGDLGVGRRVKGMAEAFYGRLQAYGAGLDGDDGRLAEALLRNLYRKGGPGAGRVEAVARYMRREASQLDGLAVDELLRGELVFGPPPAPEKTD